MQRRITECPGVAPALGPYSLATIEGDRVDTSGQIALTADGELLHGTSGEQTHQIMGNLIKILGACGCTLADVTHTSIFYTERGAFGEINEAYAQYFPQNEDSGDNEYPARTTVGVAFLPMPDAIVEIAMRAVRPTVEDEYMVDELRAA